MIRSQARNTKRKDPELMEEAIDHLTRMMIEFLKEMKNMSGIKDEMFEFKNKIAGIKDGTKQTNERMQELQNYTNLNINENRNHMAHYKKRIRFWRFDSKKWKRIK